jgi:hypothetical protein
MNHFGKRFSETGTYKLDLMLELLFFSKSGLCPTLNMVYLKRGALEKPSSYFVLLQWYAFSLHEYATAVS